jgi:hypothetical protein
MYTPLESCAVIDRANGRFATNPIHLRRSSHARRSSLSATERDNLMALPGGEYDALRYYTFTESDLSLIRQRRGDANRLGFVAQLCQF